MSLRSAAAVVAFAFVGGSPVEAQDAPREKWKGTVKLERDMINPTCSAITSTAEYTIAVAEDGSITGSGSFNHSGYTCPGGFTAPATQGRLTMWGKKENGTLRVHVSDWEPKNAFVPRLPGGVQLVQVGTSGSGEATFSPHPDMQVVFRVKLERISEVVPRG
jgi:hypothetical protein